MELLTYAGILWRRKWIIALVTILAVATGVVGWRYVLDPTYQAKATLRFSTPTSGDLTYTTFDIQYADRLMKTYAVVATSPPMRTALQEELHVGTPPTITVEIEPDSEIMNLYASSTDPTLAQAAANAAAQILQTRGWDLAQADVLSQEDILKREMDRLDADVAALEAEYQELLALPDADPERLSRLNSDIQLKQQTRSTLAVQFEQIRVIDELRANLITIVNSADKPSAPKGLSQMQVLVLVGMAGLLAGVMLAFVLDSMDHRLHTNVAIESATSLSVLGRIPDVSRRASRKIWNGDSAAVDAVHRLAINVLSATPVWIDGVATTPADAKMPVQSLDSRNAHTRTLLVTSARPQDGKSTLVANMAAAFARAGYQTLVLDGDLRLPALHKIYSLPNDIGVTSILLENSVLEEALQDSGMPGLSVLTSGPAIGNVFEALSSDRMASLMETLKEHFDIVILDGPAVLTVADSLALAPYSNGVLLVVRRGQVQASDIDEAREQLSHVGCKTIGVIVNRAQKDSADRYYRHHRRS